MVSLGAFAIVIILLIIVWAIIIFYFQNGSTKMPMFGAGGVVFVIVAIMAMILASKGSSASTLPGATDLNAGESSTSDEFQTDWGYAARLYQAQNARTWNPSSTSFGEITNAAATTTSSTISLTWSPYPKASSYVVYSPIDNKGTHTQSGNIKRTSYTVTGLTPATKYNIVIFALDTKQRKIASATLATATL